MIEQDFIQQLAKEIQGEVEKELEQHLKAKREVEVALLSYSESILETVRANTMARIRRLPDPPSEIEERALRLIASVEALPEFRRAADSAVTTRSQERAVTTGSPDAPPKVVPATDAPPKKPPPTVQEAPPEDSGAPDTPEAFEVAPAASGRPAKPRKSSSAAVTHHEEPLVSKGQTETQDCHGVMSQQEEDRVRRVVGKVSDKLLKHLKEQSQQKPLHMVAGVPEPKKLEMFKHLGINARWESRVKKSVAAIRGGRVCGVIFMIGYAGHMQYNEVKAACEAMRVPMFNVTKMGNGELLNASEAISGALNSLGPFENAK